MKTFIIAALTADGFIGRSGHHLADWTSPEDKKLFVRLTKEAGTMVMGYNTFMTIGRPLPGRRTIVYVDDPKLMANKEVEITDADPKDLVKKLEKEGVKALAICGGRSVYNLFMQAGLVDEIYVTIEPLLFGQGLSLFSEKIENSLSLLNVEKLNDNTVLLHYAVSR